MAFDSSEYRQNTYGAPDYYCDCTRSLMSNGDGSLGDPWNLEQAMANAVAGDVVGFLPVSTGTPVDMDAPSASGYSEIPAFQPANSGSGTANANRIIFVTKYAAVKLYKDDPSGIGTNQSRTELRHAGTAAVAAGASETGTGGACYGAHTRNYITYDGFYVDMAEAEIRSDTGVLAAQACTGITFKNFVVKGTTTNCQSNAIIYRPENAVDTILSNFVAYDFSNDPTGSDTQQAGLFSDQYGDQNFLIEHFEIDDIDMGIFLKGTSSGPVFNYGTIQYGIVSNTASPLRFNDLDPTNLTTVQYVLTYNTIGARPKALSPDGIVFDVISSSPRNITIDHCTVAKIDSTDGNCNGAFFVEGSEFALGSGITITNNIFDLDSGSYGHMMYLESALPGTMNYNFYYKNGATETYVYNSTEYNSFASWQAAISGRDANSVEGSSSPFNNRASDDYTINTGHAAYTMSSTSGQVGAYATNETIGVETTAAASSGSLALFLR
ncbi:MAG: hypothetical protein ABT940_00655 [Alphaproteobacteria bacterium]